MRSEAEQPRIGESVVASLRSANHGTRCEWQFEIFQRLHTREQYPCTRVGLASCKKIAERHGGNIWVEAKVGSGSKFMLTLPA